MRLRHRPWAEGTISSNRDVALTRDDEDELPSFDRLEIGSGRGLFLLEKARMEPDHSFLGLEMNYNAFALAVKRASNAEPRVENARFLNDTLEHVIDRIPDTSIEEIYLNFSDPWPKTKQQKRRLTHPDRLADYYRILKVGGKVLFKTDNKDLFDASAGYFEVFGRLKVTFQGVYETDDPDDVCTEFEQKFRDQGDPIYRIVAVKETDEPISIDPSKRPGYVPELSLYQRGKADRLTEQTFRLKSGLEISGPFEDGNISLLSDSPTPVLVAGTDLVRTLIEDFHPEPDSVSVSSLKDGDVVESDGDTLLTVDGVSRDCPLGIAISGLFAQQVRIATCARDLIQKLGADSVVLIPQGSDLDQRLQSLAFRAGGGHRIASQVGASAALTKPVSILTIEETCDLIADTLAIPAGKPKLERTVYVRGSSDAKALARLAQAYQRAPRCIRIEGVLFEPETSDLLTIRDTLDSSGCSALMLGLILNENTALAQLETHPLSTLVAVVASPSRYGPIEVV